MNYLISLNPTSFFKRTSMTGKYITAEEAARLVKSGDRVFIHGSAATPVHLIQALQARHLELQEVELVSITTLGGNRF